MALEDLKSSTPEADYTTRYGKRVGRKLKRAAQAGRKPASRKFSGSRVRGRSLSGR